MKLLSVGTEFKTVIAYGERKVPAQAVALARQALRAGKTVGVLAKSSTMYRRCQKCHDPFPCQDPTCQDGRCHHDIAPRCPRCEGTTFYLSGVDTQVISETFPAGTVALDPSKPGPQTFDVVVFLNLDAVSRRPSFNPEHAAMRAAMAAAHNMNPGGTLNIATSDETGTPLVESLPEDKLRQLVRCGIAVRSTTAPFGLVVKLRWRPPIH